MAIERKFIQQNLKELQIREHVFAKLGKVGVAALRLQRTPLGEKILITCSRPGLVVGRGGSNIQMLTQQLKTKFGLENPQIEIEEVSQPMLEPDILAEMISNSLERFGVGRFKGIGHKAMAEAMRAGALGIEILVSGKVPSQRAKTWRFYNGYLKKCGDVAVEGVNVAYRIAKLKTGVVGIKVSVMPPTTILPDRIDIKDVGSEDVTASAHAAPLEHAVAQASAPDAPKKRAPRKKASDGEAGSTAAPAGEKKPAARKRAPKKEAAPAAEESPQGEPSGDAAESTEDAQ